MATVMASPSVADSVREAIGESLDSGERSLAVRAVTDPKDFDSLQSDWDQLLRRCPDATVFQTWEWQSTWWKRFGRGMKPLIFTMGDREEVRAIAPLMIKSYVLPGLREVAFIGTGISDYLDIIAEPDWRRSAAEAAVFHINTNSHRWDFVDLGQMPPGETVDYMGETPDNRVELLHHETCPVVPLPGCWDEYSKSLGKSLRSNIGYYERSLRKQYDVCIGLAAEDDLEAELESLFSLHTARWRSRMLPGALVGKTVKEFHRDIARQFLGRGWLRLYYIKLDGVTRAALYCFAYGDSVYYYMGGFEPDLAKYGLGTILTARAIRDAIETGKSRFDMLRGNEDYKHRWRPECRINTRILISKPSLRSLTARKLHSLEARIEARFKKRVHGSH